MNWISPVRHVVALALVGVLALSSQATAAGAAVDARSKRDATHQTWIAGQAARIAREPLNRYLRSLADAASDWTTGTASKDYPGYEKMIATLRDDSFESNVAAGSAWVGTPDQIAGQIGHYLDAVGDFEVASLQVNFGTIRYADAKTSIALFAREVMPEFTRSAPVAFA